MEKNRNIFDMVVEEKGKYRRLKDWTGKIITEYNFE